MDLLQFARGPALTAATVIFVAGLVWRIVGLLLLRSRRDLSQPRESKFVRWRGIMVIATRSWPKPEFVGSSAAFILTLGYTFHLGLFAVVFLYLPHVLLLADVLRAFLPGDVVVWFIRYWPTLPGGFLYFLTSVSVACLLILLGHRLIDPVKRLISNFDDYMSWLMTISPLVTGMAAYMHLFNPYQTLLAIHILSVEALMIWLPFGKLFHAVTMIVLRATSGWIYERKGAAL